MKVIDAITVRILYEHKMKAGDPHNWNWVKILSSFVYKG